MESTYTLVQGESPIVATAIHEGHATRQELGPYFNLSDEERLREEDPFTARWVNFSDNRIIVHHSRFETDVNRPRDKAVYLKPEDAWGLNVWKRDLPEKLVSASLDVYDAFYGDVAIYFDTLFERYPDIVVFDIHSYNHRREGKNIAAEPKDNPEINIGTKNMTSRRWKPLIKSLIQKFTSFDYNGRTLDVRENVKFKGGYFGQWLHERYGERICPVSIEFKKFFMDEWTGKPFEEDIQLIAKLLEDSQETVKEALKKLES